MAQYNVTAPDGTKYQVNAPDGASDSDVMSYVQSQHATQSAPQAPGLTQVIMGDKGGASQSSLRDGIDSAVSGIPHLALGLATLPATGVRAAETAADWASKKAINAARWVGGTPALTDQQFADNAARTKTAEENTPILGALARFRDATDPTKVLGGAQDWLEQKLDSSPVAGYQPQGLAGRSAQTLENFAAPNVAGKASLITKAADTLIPAIMARVGGETLGPVGEVAGGVLGGGALGAKRNIDNAAAKAVQPAAAAVSPEQFQGMRRLIGLPGETQLSLPEAYQAETGSNALTRAAEAVGATPKGAATLGSFFAKRPEQQTNDINAFLNGIAPKPASETALGTDAANTASAAIDNSKQGRDLSQAIWASGTPTTAEQAGSAIQSDLAKVQGSREDMRAALADPLYEQARNPTPNSIPITDLGGATQKPPVAPTATPASGGIMIQNQPNKPLSYNLSSPDNTAVGANPTPAINAIDSALQTAPNGSSMQSALQSARKLMFSGAGAETNPQTLANAHTELNRIISDAQRSGDGSVVRALTPIKETLANDVITPVNPAFRQATDTYAAASRPLDAFSGPTGDQTVLGKVADTTTPAENVPGMLAKPTASRALSEVGGPQSQEAMGNYLSTKLLNGAMDANGGLNSDKLALALRDNADILNQYPEVRDRLASVIQADQNPALVNFRRGNLGQTASAPNATAGYDRLVHGGSAQDAGAAMVRFASENPDVAAAIMRHGGDQALEAAMEGTQRGPTGVGIKFAQNYADATPNHPTEQRLRAALGVVAPQSEKDLSALLDKQRATGFAPQVGSNTTDKATFLKGLGSGSGLGMAGRLIGGAASAAGLAAGENNVRLLNYNADKIARMFTNGSEGVDWLENAAKAKLANELSKTVPKALLSGTAGSQEQQNQQRK